MEIQPTLNSATTEFDLFLDILRKQPYENGEIVLDSLLVDALTKSCKNASNSYSVFSKEDKKSFLDFIATALAGLANDDEIPDIISSIISELGIAQLAAKFNQSKARIDARLDNLQADILHDLNLDLNLPTITIKKLFQINSNANKLEFLEWFSSYIEIQKLATHIQGDEKKKAGSFNDFLKEIAIVSSDTSDQLLAIKNRIIGNSPFPPFIGDKFAPATKSIPDVFLLDMDEYGNAFVDITLTTLVPDAEFEKNQLGRYHFIAKEYLKEITQQIGIIMTEDASIFPRPHSIKTIELITQRANAVANGDLEKLSPKLATAYRAFYNAKDVFKNPSIIFQSKNGKDVLQDGEEDELSSRIRIKMFNMSRGILLFNDTNTSYKAKFISYLNKNRFSDMYPDSNLETDISILSHDFYAISQLSSFYETNLVNERVRGTAEEEKQASNITNTIDNVLLSLRFKTETGKVKKANSQNNSTKQNEDPNYFFTLNPRNTEKNKILMKHFIGFLNEFKSDEEVLQFLGSDAKRNNIRKNALFLYFKQVLGNEPEYSIFISKFPNVVGNLVNLIISKKENAILTKKSKGAEDYLSFIDPDDDFFTNRGTEPDLFSSIFIYLSNNKPQKLDSFFQRTISHVFFKHTDATKTSIIIQNWKNEPEFLNKITQFIYKNKDNFDDKKYEDIINLLSSSDSKTKIKNDISSIVPGFKP